MAARKVEKAKTTNIASDITAFFYKLIWNMQ
jgi:hypothetical protein